MSKTELMRWLETIPDDSYIAIDDGGLALVEVDAQREETGAYYEVGGIPLEDDEDDDLTDDSALT